MRLLLVAPPEDHREWTAALSEAGFAPRVRRAEDAAGTAAALREPLDLVVAWDDATGERAASVLAAARGEGAAVPVAVVAQAEAEAGVLRALRQGAAAVLERDRPARLPAELVRMLEREWLEVSRVLTGRIAHDLNNLLAPIPLAVQLLERAAAPSAVRGQLQTVQVATRRSMDGVKELSELLAAEAPVPLRVRAKHLLAVASRSWRHLEEAPPAVLTDYPPDLESVRVEPVRLLQALWCLARRALDSRLGSAGGAGSLLFSGRNLPGEGAEAAGVELRVVWAPGEGLEGRGGLDRVRPPERDDRLDSVLEVVSAQGGSLAVVDAVAGRAGYALRLPGGRGRRGGRDGAPRADPRAGDRPPAAPSPERRRDRSPERRSGARHVLVIESDEEVRRVTRETLERSGWEVLTAADGTEGVAVYAENLDVLAAVLVDLTLPYLDGLATIRAVRRIGGHARMVLTMGGTWDSQRLEPGDLGPDTVLCKPYESEALLQALAGVDEPGAR